MTRRIYEDFALGPDSADDAAELEEERQWKEELDEERRFRAREDARGDDL